MTEPVVDRFEVVDVDHQERQIVTVSRRFANLGRAALVETAPIEHARQRIGRGERAQLDGVGVDAADHRLEDTERLDAERRENDREDDPFELREVPQSCFALELMDGDDRVEAGEQGSVGRGEERASRPADARVARVQRGRRTRRRDEGGDASVQRVAPSEVDRA